MIEVKDEVLEGEARYRIRDNNGNIIFDNLTIEQITPTTQEGTPINKALFESLQNDIYDIINEKTTFLLGEIEATSDCQELSISGLNIKKNEEIFIIFRSQNYLVGAGSSMGYSIKLNDTTIFSVGGYFYDCILFTRLTSASDQNYYTGTSICSSTVARNSTTTTDTEINSVSIVGVRTTEIKKGNSLLVFKRTL